jgi:hypothetical protein
MTSPITPIVATFRYSNRVFQVRCEISGEWLTPAYKTFSYRAGPDQDRLRENLKKIEYQFYKAVETDNGLCITAPAGYWLKDGRLVSPNYNPKERAEAYYGEQSEIVCRRIILFCNSINN